MNDKQFDVLAGISRSMEKSLGNIEKYLGATSKNADKTTGVLAGLSQSLASIVSSLSNKKFDEKKANTILDFSKNLVQIANSVKPKSAEAFAAFSSSVSNTFTTLIEIMSPGNILKLALASKILFGGKDPIMKRIVTGMNSMFVDLDAKKAKAGGEAIKAMGDGLVSLSKAMASFILIGIAAPLVLVGALVTKAVISLFTSFGKNAKEIKAGGLALKELGKGMVLFSAGLATLMLVTLVTSPGKVIESIAMIAVFGLTFYAIGKAGSAISHGAKAVALMGLALFGFSAGLATFMLVLMIVKPAMIIAGLAVIAGFGVVFALLGIDKVSRSIATGALLMMGMSIALAMFSLSLMVFGAAVMMFEPKNLLMGAMLIVEVGLAMALIGKFEKQIFKGAATMASMGLGLGLFSAGLIIFGLAVKLFDLDSIMIGAGLIVSIGLAFGIVGLLAPEIVAGSAAVGSMGVALVLFSAGVMLFGLAIKGISALFDNLLEAGAIAGGLILGLGLAFATVGVVGAPVVLGAAAVTTIGIALVALSVGIIIYALAIKAISALFDGDMRQAGKLAGGIILGLGLTFSAVGLMSGFILLGTAASLLMGASLLGFSIGLLTFGLSLKMLDRSGLLIKDTDGEWELKGVSVISSLAGQISKVGLYALNPFFLMGIGTSIGIGASLVSIGNGLSSAGKALKEVGDLKQITEGLFGDSGLVKTLAKQFSNIGKEYGGGLLSSFFGTDDVSVGIRVTRGFGDVLQELAGGIVAFSNFSEFPVKVPDPKDPHKLVYASVDMFGTIIPKLNQNLPVLLSTLATTFSDIGSKFGGDSGWFSEDSPVQKGVNAIKGLGNVLSELAGGIIAFANFTEFPIQVPDPSDPSKLIYKAVDLTSVIPKIREHLIGDGTTQGNGLLFSLAKIFGEIGSKYGDKMFSDGPVKKGIDAVKGIGGVISELAQGIIAFANMGRGLPNYDKEGKFNGTYTPFKIADVKAMLVNVLSAIPDVFATIDLAKINDAKKKSDAIMPLAEAIGKMSKMFTKGDDLKSFATGLTESGKAFSSFAGGFGVFSSQIDKFVKFENSFSNLLKNQNSYKFDKFAESMGVLKSNINSFNVENLKLTDSLMKSLAVLSKSDSVGSKIKESIDEAMKQLVEAINKLVENSGEQTGAIQDAFGAKQQPAVAAVATPIIQNQPIAQKPGSVVDPNQQQLVIAITELNRKLTVLSQMTFENGGLKVITID